MIKLSQTLLILMLLSTAIGCGDQKNILHVSCSESNDLYGILLAQPYLVVRQHDAPLDAVREAGNGEAVLILADAYPDQQVDISDDFFEEVGEKKLRMYLEYPAYLPGLQMGEPVHSTVERIVVASDFFNGMPDSLQILGVNGLNYLPVEVNESHLLAARIAGFDHAVYGLPEKTAPILFELPDSPVLVSTTCLSRFIRGRYAPQKEWAAVWRQVMSFILPEAEIADLEWQPVVSTTYVEETVLPNNYQKSAVRSGIEWFINSKMLVHESYSDTLERIKNSNLLKWRESIPIGNGSQGALEGIMSIIDENGSQPIGTVKRGDCIGETAMAFATAGTLLQNTEYLEISKNLLDYYLVHSPAAANEWIDPTNSAYGLIPWGITNYAWYKANYGDDNARELIGSLVTAAFTDTDQWDEIIMKCLLAQLRTTGINGFRGSRIDLEQFAAHDWKYFYNREIVNFAPHYEAYMWACFLWAYDKTGERRFLERAEKAIKMTMDQYPEGWSWTNGLAQEKARMVLPLSWLVRVEDTPENRAMLLKVVNDLLRLQAPCGAIREELGDLKMGSYPPPQSNEAYGTNEASLIGENGDPVSDLLYTTNFAFLGLHEASYATGDPVIKEATNRLAEFLCRIQVKSEAHPELHGGWFRAFDYERFEHWGCNADHGWGAWCIESGWTQGWITTILALRQMDTSIWDLTHDSKVNLHFEPLRDQMLPGVE